MNKQYSTFKLDDKPSGYTHIQKEFWDVMKQMMVTLRDKSPLSKYESVACKFEPTYLNFARNPTGKQQTGNWYNADYSGPTPFVSINVTYYIIPGYHMEPIELKDCGYNIKLTINMDVIINTKFPTYCPHDYLCVRLMDISYDIYNKYHEYIEQSDAQIKEARSLRIRHTTHKYYKCHPELFNKMSVVQAMTNFGSATIFYNDGSTSIIYKHSDISYTIETFNRTSIDTTFEEVDGDNASERVSAYISKIYSKKLGIIKIFKD